MKAIRNALSNLLGVNPELERLVILNNLLLKKVEKLEHELQVQRARTGDQRNLVTLLKKRLAELGDVADPIKAARQQQSRPKKSPGGVTRHEALLARQAARAAHPKEPSQ